MFDLVYAKSVVKDLRKIAPHQFASVKAGIEELRMFPNISQIKRLNNHPFAEYRLRIGSYRVLFDVNWEQQEIDILKIGHRRDVY